VAAVRLGKIKCAAKAGRLVGGFAALFILRRDSQTALPNLVLSVGLYLSVNGCTVGLLGLLITVSGLAKVAIFTTELDAENQCLINPKTVCGTLNRHFCQTAVKGWLLF